MIRKATTQDVPAIVELGRAMFAESPVFAGIEFSGPTFECSLLILLASERALVLVAEIDSEIVAAMIAGVAPHWMACAIEATELGLYVVPRMRGRGIAHGLIQRFKAFAEEHGATILRAGAAAGIDDEGVIALYEASGFKRSGVTLQLG